jgi:acetyl esterase/lipase
MLRLILAACFVAAMAGRTLAEETPAVIHLWDNGAPGFESRKDMPEVAVQWGIAGINNPSLTVFLPPQGRATGAAAVIVPGGGHRMLVVDLEGYALAKWLASKGVAGFVLKYRLAKDQTAKESPYRIDVEELQDTTRALRLVRSRAAESTRAASASSASRPAATWRRWRACASTRATPPPPIPSSE